MNLAAGSTTCGVRMGVTRWNSIPAFVVAARGRGFATSSTARLLSERGKRQLRSELDGKLRLAINLYHISDKFFASRPSIRKQDALGMPAMLGNNNKNATIRSDRPSAIEDDVRSDTYKIGDVGGDATTLSEASTENAEEAEDPVETRRETPRPLDQQLDFHILSALRLLPREHEPIEQYRLRAQRSRSSIAFRNTIDVEEAQNHKVTSREQAMHDDMGTYDRPIHANDMSIFSSRFTTSGKAGGASLPDVKDVEAVRAYMGEIARKMEVERRQNEMSLRDPNLSLDNRSGRVRDALYGTVHAQLPGLETVRERARQSSVRDEATRFVQGVREERQRAMREERRKALEIISRQRKEIEAQQKKARP